VNRKLWIVLNLALAGAVVWTTIELRDGWRAAKAHQAATWAAPWPRRQRRLGSRCPTRRRCCRPLTKKWRRKTCWTARAIPTFRSRRLRAPASPAGAAAAGLSRIHESGWQADRHPQRHEKFGARGGASG